jgi:uncharacterized repeat protein (TIGR03803 family)
MKLATILLSSVCALLIATSQAAAQTETVLHSFTTAEGVSPVLGLVFDSAGNLYGVASEGGGTNAGTVFELIPSGSSWTEKTIYRFKGSTDGATPLGSLIVDSSGNLYGTTNLGGTKGVGTVFELRPNGATWTKTILHNFGGARDGEFPSAGLAMDASGNLYGTTEGGGAFGNGQNNVGGTAYKLAPRGGTWTETVIHSFGSGTDGAVPRSNLTLDTSGNLYGTSTQGGAKTFGAVFKISPQSGGGWKESVLHSFNPGNFEDGDGPVAGVIFDNAGNLYGTTTSGGEQDGGVVFELSPAGGTWTETILASFEQPFYQPSALYTGLVLDKAGNLYGATLRGGNFVSASETFFNGTVFELTPSGHNWKYTTLFFFDGTHGAVPGIGALVLDSSNNLYGATQAGGANKNGVVFKITP